MYGTTVASLNLYMKQAGKPEALVWNLNGSQVQLKYCNQSQTLLMTKFLQWVLFSSSLTHSLGHFFRNL